jgi:metal-responsive CopG/Arc/MetJ family transcriptional regulator
MKRIKFQTSLPEVILRDVEKAAERDLSSRTAWLEKIVRKELYKEGFKRE